ncbi:M50 family metallopeptidase [Melittangium boletus]|uniref:M50 family metallopeptidase n=1 Tax=Melittangium boletus TaxID=83453 RepID=UPI003DA24D92
MSTYSPSPFSWQFNLGRIPVVVEPSFWLITALFGLMGARENVAWTGIWVGVCFVSILIHELGHALAAMTLGSDLVHIRLYEFGGLTTHQVISRWRDVAVTAAGPLAGFLFGGLMVAVHHYVPATTEYGQVAYSYLKFVNFFWGFVNLLPVLPLDGGHILSGVLGPTRQRIALWVGVVVAAGVTALALLGRAIFVAFMFGRMAYTCWQALSYTRDLKPLEPVRPAEDTEPVKDLVAQGWQALRSGQESEAARLGHLAFSVAAPGEETNTVRDLLAWVALSEGNPRAALSQLEKVAPPEAVKPYSLAMAYEAAGLHERALPPALRAQETEPSEATVALAVRLLVRAQRLPEAERSARDFAWRNLARRDALLADIAVARGDYGAAASLFARTFETTGRAEEAYQAALNHARGDQVEHATEWLKRALDAGYDDLDTALQEPALALVRATPEIAQRLTPRQG